MLARYYVCDPPGLLLRRFDGGRDEVFLRGEWVPTPLIVDHLHRDHDDLVRGISEEQARGMFPDIDLRTAA